jgi:hypothetical protein
MKAHGNPRSMFGCRTLPANILQADVRTRACYMGVAEFYLASFAATARVQPSGTRLRPP